MNQQPQRSSPSSRYGDQNKPRRSRRRGTRGSGRTISPKPGGTGASSGETAKAVLDPAARQQMKQTMAIALMTNPAIPLPFPLAIPLGVTMLAYQGKKEEPSQ
ncbi:hypothetical protein ACJ41O_009442 [Fusarium nematophilum]